MRKFIFSVFALSLASSLCAYEYGFWNVNKTSHTQVASSGLRIEDASKGDVLIGVHVGTCGGPGASITIFDSSATTAVIDQLFVIDASSNSVIGSYACSSSGTHLFHVQLSSSLTYSSAGTPAPNFTILWSDNDIGD